jgi:HipA-like protein
MVRSALNVWMNGELVGVWRVDRGSHSFTYEPAWLESPKARSLSLSLPITASREIRGAVVAHYFDNLLPDNDEIRERLAQRFDTASSAAFQLLAAFGRDCVGAVQLLPEDMQPEGWNRIHTQALDDEQIVAILRAVPTLGVTNDGDEDLFRISIAGAQEKPWCAAWEEVQRGGPGMKACLQLLQGSADPQDLRLFQLTQLAFWLLGATDGHAKNFSIFLQPGDSYVMTPLYDILSMWPYAGEGPRQFRRKKAGLAMAVRSKNAHYSFDEIQTRHWHQLATGQRRPRYVGGNAGIGRTCSGCARHSAGASSASVQRATVECHLSLHDSSG